MCSSSSLLPENRITDFAQLMKDVSHISKYQYTANICKEYAMFSKTEGQNSLNSKKTNFSNSTRILQLGGYEIITGNFVFSDKVMSHQFDSAYLSMESSSFSKYSMQISPVQ
jgi:hypothetical protein